MINSFLAVHSLVGPLGRVKNAFASMETHFDRANYRLFRLGSGEAWKTGGEVHQEQGLAQFSTNSDAANNLFKFQRISHGKERGHPTQTETEHNHI